MSPTMLELTDERRRALTQLVTAWAARRAGEETTDAPLRRWVEVREVEVLSAGRPALLDVIAEVEGRLGHAVLGVRRPGEEAHFLRANDEPVLGLFEDDVGLGVVLDALFDAELAPELLSAVTGERAEVTGVAPVAETDEGTVLAFSDRCSLTVFPWVTEGPNPGVELLVALDEAGFNHLAAPLARWQRGGRDLGLVQELLAGSAGGWALALTSLRDLYASGRPEEAAGGDFGPEARALGTMTARMHLALDQAFGRRSAEVADLVDGIERGGGGGRPERARRARGGRGARLAALGGPALPDGRDPRRLPPGADGPHRPGLGGGRHHARGVPAGATARVASLAAGRRGRPVVVAAPRGVGGRLRARPDRALGLAALARAWEARNRRAFLSGYLSTPGIGGLVPGDRDGAQPGRRLRARAGGPAGHRAVPLSVGSPPPSPWRCGRVTRCASGS